VLICGPMGTGKSTIGELLAVELKNVLKLPTEVVKNMDLTLKGLLLEDVFATPTLGSPVVLMLDEFDTTIEHAESEKSGKGEGTSLAETPTSLLSLLDRLNRTPYLVVIATSNRTVAEMTASTSIYGRYTRAGRIDIHIDATM
jgi:SpoVK/Ycf46/Vps4 family AAA+-type ATPase